MTWWVALLISWAVFGPLIAFAIGWMTGYWCSTIDSRNTMATPSPSDPEKK